MEKHLEGVANLAKALSRFEELSDNYINNLSVLTQRKAQEAEARKRKMEFMLSLATKVDDIYRKMKKLGLLDEEVRAH